MSQGRALVVHEVNGGFYLKDLTYFCELRKREVEKMVLYFHKYPESECPEVDNPLGHARMYEALYDMYQCDDDIKEGDMFKTPFGDFFTYSFHVLDEEEYLEAMGV